MFAPEVEATVKSSSTIFFFVREFSTQDQYIIVVFNSRYRLIQYKALHRLHYSKTKLNRIFPSVSPVCDKCHIAEGSLAHLSWFCPKLHNFCSAIFEQLSKAYSSVIQPNHDLAILGCSAETSDLLHDTQVALHLGMVVDKKLILLAWKSSTPPTFAHWLSEMLSVIRMERLRLHKPNKQNRFGRIWGSFLASVRCDACLNFSHGTCFILITATMFFLQVYLCESTTVWQPPFFFLSFPLFYFMFDCHSVVACLVQFCKVKNCK